MRAESKRRAEVTPRPFLSYPFMVYGNGSTDGIGDKPGDRVGRGGTDREGVGSGRGDTHWRVERSKPKVTGG